MTAVRWVAGVLHFWHRSLLLSRAPPPPPSPYCWTQHAGSRPFCKGPSLEFSNTGRTNKSGFTLGLKWFCSHSLIQGQPNNMLLLLHTKLQFFSTVKCWGFTTSVNDPHQSEEQFCHSQVSLPFKTYQVLMLHSPMQFECWVRFNKDPLPIVCYQPVHRQPMAPW